MASVPVELLRELEIEGYTAVMRAIYAGSYDWVGMLCFAVTNLPVVLRDFGRRNDGGLFLLSMKRALYCLMLVAGEGRNFDQASRYLEH